MSRRYTLQVPLTQTAYEQLEREAAEAECSLAELARRKLAVPHQDGRARRWEELRDRLQLLVREQPDEVLTAILGLSTTSATVRAQAQARVMGPLDLGRDATAQELGVLAELAEGEWAARLEQPEPDED